MEHKAPTSYLHASRSWASQLSSFQVIPFSLMISSSSSRALLHIPKGHPLFLFPDLVYIVYIKATTQIEDAQISLI